MQKIFRQIPLYRFLMFCNENSNGINQKKILDCGAGGTMPPLSMFAEAGYKTTGIEFDQNQLEIALEFSKQKKQNLNIKLGDMRKLEFENEEFDFVYSYNSIFHMKKTDIKKSITELKRVLKPGGLIFVNMLSIDDRRCGEGNSLGKNQYEQKESDDTEVIHSYFGYDEADQYFKDMELVYKERRFLKRKFENGIIEQGFIDYILRK